MDKNKKTPNALPDDLVKSVFDRPKAVAGGVSSIFTYSKNIRKIVPSSKKELAEALSDMKDIKPLPVVIDIGSRAVKMIRLGVDEKKRFEIINVDSQPYDAPSVKDSFSATKNALVALRGRNDTGPACVTALSARDVQIYNMMFPPMPDEELESAIRFKIAQLKPFGLSWAKLVCKFKKWKITENTGGVSQERVVIACVSKDALARHIALLEAAGFKPVSVESPQFGLVNLSSIYEQSEYEEDVELWVHIGAEESFLAVSKSRSLCFSKEIVLTSDRINKNIAKQCRVSEEKAEELKKEHGFSFWSKDKVFSPLGGNVELFEKSKDSSEQIYYALVSALENLVVEIELLFKHFSFQVAQSQVRRFSRVILSGGGAKLKNLEKFLNVKLGVPVEYFDPFSVFRVLESVKKQKAVLVTEPGLFTIGAGLSIGQKAASTRRVNFLPESGQEPLKILWTAFRQRPVQIVTGLLVVSIVLSGFLAGTAGFYKSRMEESAKKVDKAKIDLSKHEILRINLAKEENELVNRKKILEAQLKILNDAKRNPVDVSKMLGSIAALLPEEVWVNSLKYEEGKFVIVGSTVNLVLITQLIEKVKETDVFSDAKFSYTQKEQDKQVYSFEVVVFQ
ncbi:MAG: pilus assembly protein PilM [Candidatus Omnitrophota bacterium]